MFEAFRDHLAGSALIPAGSRVLVGYSGGADSTCLLHLLHRAGIEVAAAHLNHGMRPEADDHAEACRRFCDDLGVPFLLGKADVPLMAKELRIGIEEAGRQARYEFLERGRLGLELDQVATAHTQDDQVETILLSWLRGAGLNGLAGMPAERDSIIRPLLAFSREETARYCADHNLVTLHDPGNEDERFRRVAIRKRVVPELRNVQPRFEEAVLRSAQIIREESDYLDSVAAAALERALAPAHPQLEPLTSLFEAAFETARLAHYPRPLLRRALRLAIRSLGARLDFHQSEIAAEGVARAEKGSLTAEGEQVVLEWGPDRTVVRRLDFPRIQQRGLEVPGSIQGHGWSLALAMEPQSPISARLSPQRLIPPLLARGIEPGDAMDFKDKPRKLTDLREGTGLTGTGAKLVPILCDQAGPIWFPGIAVSQRVAAKDQESAIIVSLLL